jgi:hypothetical protein
MNRNSAFASAVQLTKSTLLQFWPLSHRILRLITVSLVLLSSAAYALPPTVEAPTPDQNYTQGFDVDLGAGAAFDDPEGDPLSFSAIGLRSRTMTG